MNEQPKEQPKVELYLNGKIFSGWKRVFIYRSLESMSGQFDLAVKARLEDDISDLKPGSALVLKIEQQTVITGFLDEIHQRISKEEKEITLSGRDKTADLVDCAVIHHSYQFKNRSLQQIAEDLCQPFNINVVWQVQSKDAAEKIAVWQVEPGETVFDTLSKLARHKGVLVTSNVEGDLVFTEPSQTLSEELILGGTLLSIDSTDSWLNRFSLYRVIGDCEQGGEKGNSSEYLFNVEE